LSVPFVAEAEVNVKPSGEKTMKWIAPPPCCTPSVTPLVKLVVSSHGPGAGLVKTNSQPVSPLGTGPMLSSLTVSHVPFSAPLPVQSTVTGVGVSGVADWTGPPVGAVVVGVVVVSLDVVEGAVVVVVGAVVVVVVVVVASVPVPVFPVLPVVDVVALVSGAAGDDASSVNPIAVDPSTATVTAARVRTERFTDRPCVLGAPRHCLYVSKNLIPDRPYRQLGFDLSIGLLAYAAARRIGQGCCTVVTRRVRADVPGLCVRRAVRPTCHAGEQRLRSSVAPQPGQTEK
jgi:hypothetical protein